MESGKNCKKCGPQPLCNFRAHPNTSDRLTHICAACKSVEDKARRNGNLQYYKNMSNARDRKWCEDNPEARMLRQALWRSRKKKVPFYLSIEDITIPKFCPYLGIELIRGKGKICSTSPSVDEIVVGKGYIKGNVQIISAKANAMKRDGTPEELLQFAHKIIEQFRSMENNEHNEVKLCDAVRPESRLEMERSI